MTALGDMTLLRPMILLALPVIAALAVLATRRYATLGSWRKQIDPHLMQAMESIGRVEGAQGKSRGLLPFWTAGVICLALTGPAIEGGNGQTFRNMDGVVYVIDVSDSMTMDESWQDVVTVARSGLQVLGSKPAALIIFAGDSYVASTLTNDTVQLGQTLSLLDSDTVPDKGSRPALALKMAAEVLAKAEIIAGDVVLFTDGFGLGPDALIEAQGIAQLGGRLMAVRVPSVVSGEPAADRAAFDALATLGGGRAYELNELNSFVDDLGRAEDERLERQNLQLLFWTDYGRFVLVLALIPLAGMFRRRLV